MKEKNMDAMADFILKVAETKESLRKRIANLHGNIIRGVTCLV